MERDAIDAAMDARDKERTKTLVKLINTVASAQQEYASLRFNAKPGAFDPEDAIILEIYDYPNHPGCLRLRDNFTEHTLTTSIPEEDLPVILEAMFRGADIVDAVRYAQNEAFKAQEQEYIEQVHNQHVLEGTPCPHCRSKQ